MKITLFGLTVFAIVLCAAKSLGFPATLIEMLLVFATGAGPVLAVQITRYLDDRSEERKRKIQIYKILMATRAYNLSPGHVEALNSIDTEFSPNSKTEKKVLESWSQYLDHLNNKNLLADGVWEDKRVDLFSDLLYYMGQSLGYDFDRTQIKNRVYSPMAHGKIEDEQGKIRQYAVDLLDGKRQLNVKIIK